MIRIDEIWLATEPMDIRAGTDAALARVIKVFGAAYPHQRNCSIQKSAEICTSQVQK